MRCLRNWAGGKRRVSLPHNANAMSGIVAHLFRGSLSLHIQLCLLLYLPSFLSLHYFLYDGMVRQGPRRYPIIHEHRRFATDYGPSD